MDKKIQIRYNLLQILFWIVSCSVSGYVAIYLKAKGLDNTQIGLVTGISCVLIMFLSPMVSSLLQKNTDLTIPSLVTRILLCTTVLFLGVSYLTLPAIVLMVLYVIIISGYLSCVPLVSTVAMNYIERGYDVNFGLARGMGSVSYAISAVVLSCCVELFDPNVLSVIHAVAVGLLLVLINTFPDYQEGKKKSQTQTGSILIVITKYKLLFVILLGWAFTFSAATTLSTYLINVVENLGGNTTIYGFAIFAMASSELPAMAVTRKLMRKYNTMTLIIVAGLAYLIRNVLIAIAPSLLFVFIGVIFQSFSYGLLTSMITYYVTDTCEKEDQIMGQTLIGIMTTGLGSMSGNVLGGILQDAFGLQAMLTFAIGMTVAGSLILVGTGITQLRKTA